MNLMINTLLGRSTIFLPLIWFIGIKWFKGATVEFKVFGSNPAWWWNRKTLVARGKIQLQDKNAYTRNLEYEEEKCPLFDKFDEIYFSSALYHFSSPY